MPDWRKQKKQTLYCWCLLQFGRANIETAQRNAHKNEDSDEDETCSEDVDPPNNNEQRDQLVKQPNGLKKSNNGYVPNGNSVISRDDKLILVPEPPFTILKKDGELSESKVFSTISPCPRYEFIFEILSTGKIQRVRFEQHFRLSESRHARYHRGPSHVEVRSWRTEKLEFIDSHK